MQNVDVAVVCYLWLAAVVFEVDVRQESAFGPRASVFLLVAIVHIWTVVQTLGLGELDHRGALLVPTVHSLV